MVNNIRGRKNGTGRGVGMLGGLRRNQNTEPCPTGEGEGRGGGSGKGRGENRT